jgi:hypothetical protein
VGYKIPYKQRTAAITLAYCIRQLLDKDNRHTDEIYAEDIYITRNSDLFTNLQLKTSKNFIPLIILGGSGEKYLLKVVTKQAN